MATKTEPQNDFKSETLTPRTTPYLLGHEVSEREFFDCFKSGAFHHSWIISGQKGIGKATFAYRIIRYIFSLNNQDLLNDLNLDTKLDMEKLSTQTANIFDDEDDDDDSDGYETDISDDSEVSYSSAKTTDTPSIKKSENLDLLDKSPLKLSPTHPIFERLLAGGITDLMVVEREFADSSHTKLKSEISVEQIRQLKEFFSKTSSEGGYKIALIDCVDEMNPNSSNALLKILEEAPNKSLLLLICNNYEGLLDTIKSRCRVLKLHPLSDENMSILLRDYIDGISDSDVKNLIELSEGSIGTAISFYNNNGIDILNLFFEVIPDLMSKKNKKILDLCLMVGNIETKLKIFEQIYITFLNNLIKLNAKLPVVFASTEEEKITKLCAKYFTNSDSLFAIREQSLNDFNLVPILNLDYTATIISAFERIKNAY